MQPLGTKLYYSIGEVADLTDLQPYTLRAWEKEFSCLRPRRVRGKNRAYRERDIGIILLIKRLLYEERYSTRGVQKKLKSEPELVRWAAENVDLSAPSSPPAEKAHASPPPAGPGATAGGLRFQGARSTPPPAGPEDLKAVLTEVADDLREVLKKLS